MIDELLDYVDGHSLDIEQREVVLDESDSLLVVASAGSGKTLTILGKIRYLVEVKKLKPEEILCLSFTNDTVSNLKNKLWENYHYEVPVYTFHKLSLEILKDVSFSIAPSDYLNYTTCEFFEGVILAYPKLIRWLLLYFHKNPFSLKKYDSLKKEFEFQGFIRELISIMGRMKVEGIPKEQLFTKKPLFWKERFLRKLLYVLCQEYEIELSSQNFIDFDDMILLATNKVKSMSTFNYRYILIDEYQDTSNIRFSFVHAIQERTGAKIMAVGDDFQSIYRFSGCNLDLFIKFSDYFQNAKLLKLENTYRNSQELINIAGKFILKNKNQLRKRLKSSKREDFPIQIVWYQNEKVTFSTLIEKLYNEGRRRIMILGRNNKDIYHALSQDFMNQNGIITCQKYPDLYLYYKTIHRSKGLEEDTVIIIHLENIENGLPNLRKELRIVSSLFPIHDFYPYSEERRLFYVGLTRTKKDVYLLTSKKNPSIFVLELQKIMKQKGK